MVQQRNIIFLLKLKKKVRNENYNLNVKENYRYNKENGDYFGKKYDYYRNDYGDGTLDYITEKSKELKKSEINYLENYLSSLLKERSKLENELEEMPKNPRTLTDIKSKNKIKDKISQNKNEIQNIQKKLKKERGY